MAQRIFVTGFGAFGTVATNPTTVLAEECGQPHALLEVAWDAVDEFLASLNPDDFDSLLLMGVAAGRTEMCAELFARNHAGQAPDVRGVRRFGLFDSASPNLLASSLWGAESVAHLTYHRVLRPSYDAGSYLCNYIHYQALRRFPEKRVGFLHVPTFQDLAQEVQIERLGKILSALL